MFVSASTHCFPEMSLGAACERLTELGFDKVEIWFDAEGKHLDAKNTAADPERFATAFREMTRISPIALCLEDVGEDPQTIGGLARVAKLLRLAQITVPASPIGTPFNDEVDRLKSYRDAASPDGVQISIKTRAGDLTEDPHTAIELCRAVKNLGLTLDPSYYLCGPNAGRKWDVVYPYVYHCHLRDTTPEEIQVPVGLGEIDYSKLISRVGRHGHDPALSIELLTDHLDLDSRPLEMRKLRMLLESFL